MERHVSLQEVLDALGGPLGETSLWALLYQTCCTLKKEFQEVGAVKEYLITPESMLLECAGTVQLLPGISHRNSKFAAPELQSTQCNVNMEKCYIYSLGISMLAAMQNELKLPKVLQISKKQHSLLLSMTDEDYNNRPSLEEILEKCTASSSQTSKEIVKLVSYVLGTMVEYSDDDKVEEADLEAEIKQVISMKGTGSTENLYPPSYGSRTSSSFSLGSSGGYSKSFCHNASKINCHDNMYSSLPMVFSSALTMEEQKEQLTQNKSDDQLTRQQESNNHQSLTPLQEPVVSYGSHLYTPSRKKRHVETRVRVHKCKNSQSQNELWSCDDDKHTCIKDTADSNHLPSHQPSVDAELSSNPKFLPAVDDNKLKPIVDVAASQKGGVSSIVVIMTGEKLALSNEPSATSDDETITAFDKECDHVPSSKNASNNISQSQDFGAELQTIGEQPQEHMLGTSTTIAQSRMSLKKLSKLFGPEFGAINGLQIEGKSGSARLPIDRRQIDVVLLNGRTVQFTVEMSSSCRELFNQVIAHQSLEETHIFGLAVIEEYGELFLELDCKLIKYARKRWVSKRPRVSTAKFVVFFRVKYYVENVNHLHLNQTRHLYYLQLRKDILEAKTYCHEQQALKLAAYSLQAEKGDRSKVDYESNFCVKDFFTKKVIRKLGEEVIQSVLPGMHSELEGMNREVAELYYLKEAQTLPEYGMMFYEVAREKHAKIGSVWLGLSVRGIVVYNVHKGTKTPDSHWPWKKIKNLSFKNQQFLVDVDDGRTLRFYTDSYKKARYLLHLCVNYHRFQLLPRVLPAEANETLVTEQLTTELFPEKKSAATDTSMAVSDSVLLPDGDTFSINLEKGGGVLGLRLAGGRNKIFGSGFVYVKSLNESSIAACCGRIKEKDILLEVNGKSVYGKTHKEAAGLIMSSSQSVSLCFHRLHNSKWWDDASERASKSLVKDESWSDLTTTQCEVKQLSTISEEK